MVIKTVGGFPKFGTPKEERALNTFAGWPDVFCMLIIIRIVYVFLSLNTFALEEEAIGEDIESPKTYWLPDCDQTQARDYRCGTRP